MQLSWDGNQLQVKVCFDRTEVQICDLIYSNCSMTRNDKFGTSQSFFLLFVKQKQPK